MAMTTDDLSEIFELENDEFIKFERVENPLHPRPDICAFLLLDKLVPDTQDIVCATSHDEIHLSVDPEELAKVITRADIITLVRCGVMYSGDGLSMFV